MGKYRKKRSVADRVTCFGCGMHVGEGPRYHPYLACLAFHACRDGKTVEASVRAIVGYGMRAERAGVTLDTAMTDLRAVPHTDTEASQTGGEQHGD